MDGYKDLIHLELFYNFIPKTVEVIVLIIIAIINCCFRYIWTNFEHTNRI